MTLRRALLILVALVVTVALFPVSLVVREQTRRALIERMRDDLENAPLVLEDRWGAIATVRMMHARDLSIMPGLPQALTRGDTVGATRLLTEGLAGLPEVAALFDADGRRVAGMADPPTELIEATRVGEMPVSVVAGEGGLHLLALAPVKSDGAWLGAAGGTTPVDDAEAQTLAGLTRTDVVILGPEGAVSGSSLAPERTAALGPRLFELMQADTVSSVSAADVDYRTTSGVLPGGVKAFFIRDVAEDLEIVPALQRSILVSSGVAILFALLVGGLFAAAVARPVGTLAGAVDRLRAGDVDAPLPASGLAEVERLSAAFREMRAQLAARLKELQSANAALEDRQQRLASLQAELVQRERRLATGQLVAQLAHEIRNPIASIRNCLEVIVRELDGQDKAEEFAHLAIEELLRMHELAEQMLAMNRPDDEETDVCARPAVVAEEVARLVTAGQDASGVSIVGDPELRAAIPREGLKQVLLNLILNAREASGNGPVEVLVHREGEEAVVSVMDRGPGVPDDLLARIFDPFFTTKTEVRGVGLGLFIAEAIVRRYGGRIGASNRSDGPGASFEIAVAVPDPSPVGSEA